MAKQTHSSRSRADQDDGRDNDVDSAADAVEREGCLHHEGLMTLLDRGPGPVAPRLRYSRSLRREVTTRDMCATQA